MTCTNFPKDNLVPNVTRHQVGNVTYLYKGGAPTAPLWEAITGPLAAKGVTVEGGGSVQDFMDTVKNRGVIFVSDLVSGTINTESAVQLAFDTCEDGNLVVIDVDFTNENNFLLLNKNNIKIQFQCTFTSNCTTLLAAYQCANLKLYEPSGSWSNIYNPPTNMGLIPAGWHGFGIIFYQCTAPKIIEPELYLNGVLPVTAAGGSEFNVLGGSINEGGDNSIYAFNCQRSKIVTTSKDTRAGRAITVHRESGHQIVATIHGGKGFGVSCVGASNTTITANCHDIEFDNAILFNRAAVSVEGNEAADVSTLELDTADADPSLINNAYSRNVTVNVTAHNCGDGAIVGLGPRGNNGSVVVTPHVTDCVNGIRAVDARGLTVTGGKLLRMQEAGVRIASPALGSVSKLKIAGVQFDSIDLGGNGYHAIHKDPALITDADSVIIDGNTYTDDYRRCNMSSQQAIFIDDYPSTPTFTVKRVGRSSIISATGSGLSANPSFQPLLDLSEYIGNNGVLSIKMTMGDGDRVPIKFAIMDYNVLTNSVYNKSVSADTTEDVTITDGIVNVLVSNGSKLGYGSLWRLTATAYGE